MIQQGRTRQSAAEFTVKQYEVPNDAAEFTVKQYEMPNDAAGSATKHQELIMHGDTEAGQRDDPRRRRTCL